MISIEYHTIMIENYTAIDHADAHQIEIQTKKQRIVIRGEKLEITAMSKDEIAIRGIVEAVMLDE